MAWKNKKKGKTSKAKPRTVRAKAKTGPTTVVPRPAVEPEPTPELAPDLLKESAKALRETPYSEPTPKWTPEPTPEPAPLPKVIKVKPPVPAKHVELYADPKLKRYPIDTPGQVDNAYSLATSETNADRAVWGRGYMNMIAEACKARARELKLVRTWAPRK